MKTLISIQVELSVELVTCASLPVPDVRRAAAAALLETATNDHQGLKLRLHISGARVVSPELQQELAARCPSTAAAMWPAADAVSVQALAAPREVGEGSAPESADLECGVCGDRVGASATVSALPPFFKGEEVKAAEFRAYVKANHQPGGVVQP